MVAVSSEAGDVIGALNGAGIGIVPIEPCMNLPRGIQSHADLQLIHLGGNKVITASAGDETLKMLDLLGAENIKTDDLQGIYPGDSLLNSAILGNHIILNEKIADNNILKYAEEKNLDLISVKQGYSRCSVLILAGDAVITADEGIAAACEDREIEVLKIHPGNIFLPGYDTGFIGGCGGLIEKKILGTAGNIKSLKNDCDNIKDFLRNRNIYIENLGGNELRDIGGILPLCEMK